MASTGCPYKDCTWTSSDQDKPLLTVLLQTHERSAHPVSATIANPVTTLAEKVKCLIASAGGTEEWPYFIQRWTIYKSATRITGQDVIYKLLD